jgi:hypothetical protein
MNEQMPNSGSLLALSMVKNNKFGHDIYHNLSLMMTENDNKAGLLDLGFSRWERMLA